MVKLTHWEEPPDDYDQEGHKVAPQVQKCESEPLWAAAQRERPNRQAATQNTTRIEGEV